MNQAPIFSGSVTADGVLVLADAERSRRAAHLRRLAGTSVDVIIRKRKSKRSLAQNAWIWAVAYPLLAESWGYDRHEREGMHYALIGKCFGLKWNEKLQMAVPVARSSKLSTKAFSEYMEWLIRFAAADGIVIPLPGEADIAALDTEIDNE